MFETRFRLPSSRVAAVISHLNDTAHRHLKPDVSDYAPGRMRVWLEHEGPLSGRQPFKPGLVEPKLWDWCCRVAAKAGMPRTPDLGLAIYGQVGIDLHRDARYAASQPGVSINLGATDFLFDHNRDSDPERFEKTRDLRLKPDVRTYPWDTGEVSLFHPKFRHSAVDPNPERWVIILWNLNRRAPDVMRKFDAYQERNGILVPRSG